MDDLGKVEVMARENNWITLPPTPVRPGAPRLVEHGPNWSANGFFVHTWLWLDGKLPTCFVGLRRANANRDEFVEAISSLVELKFIRDTSVLPQLRQEQYEISIGPTKLQLSTATKNDGTMASARISKAAPALPYYGLPDR
jgi:hypothetical protein